jgi:chromosome partitioning protein
MSKVITICAAKGGAGKSTISVNLAVDLSKNHNVLLIDSEEEGTTLDWQDARDDASLTIINGYDKSMPAMLDVYRQSYDFIIIDTAGANVGFQKDLSANLQAVITSKVMARSDFILVPIKPAPIDVRKTLRFLPVVESMVEASFGMRKALLVINHAKKNERHTNEAKSLFRDYSELLPLSGNMIRSYVEHEKAEGEFLSVNEYAPSSNAALDMRLLTKEILKIIG